MAEFGLEGVDGVVLGVSVVRFSQSISRNAMDEKDILLPLVGELPGVPGKVVAVLAWVGAWPGATVDPGTPSVAKTPHSNPALALTKHWVP